MCTEIRAPEQRGKDPHCDLRSWQLSFVIELRGTGYNGMIFSFCFSFPFSFFLPFSSFFFCFCYTDTTRNEEEEGIFSQRSKPLNGALQDRSYFNHQRRREISETVIVELVSSNNYLLCVRKHS